MYVALLKTRQAKSDEAQMWHTVLTAPVTASTQLLIWGLLIEHAAPSNYNFGSW